MVSNKWLRTHPLSQVVLTGPSDKTMTRQLFILLILLTAVFTTAHNSLAQTPAAPPAPHDHSHISATPESASAAEKYFTDVELINQDGKKVRFYSDVLKGKTVVVNAF